LVDLVQVIQEVIEDAAEDLARRVAVSMDSRRSPERLRRIGSEPIEELVGHDGDDLTSRLVVCEPDEMIPGACVSSFQMTDGIMRRGSERPRSDHADARRLGEYRLAVSGGAEHAIPRCPKDGFARTESRGRGHVVLLFRGTR